jgi:hypothetical protein
MHAPAPKAEIKLSAEAWAAFLCAEWFYREFVYYDSSFKNTLDKPQPTKADKVGKPSGHIPPSNGKFDPWARQWDRPRFDLGAFYKAGHLDFLDYVVIGTSADSDQTADLRDQLKTLARSTGGTISAIWEGGNVANPRAKITAKFGSSSYESLLSGSRRLLNLGWTTVSSVSPPELGRLAAAAVTKHKLLRPYRRDGRLFHNLLIRHNGRLLPLIGRGWFGASYPKRWDWSASCYLDIRIDGKASNSADITWIQAAAREAEEAIDCLSTGPTLHKLERPQEYVSGDDDHAQAQEDAAALAAYLWDYRRLYDEAEKKTCVLGMFLLWLAAGLHKEEKCGPHKPKPPPRHCNIYWHRRDNKSFARLVTLNELLDDDYVAESKKRDASPPPASPTVFLEPEEELELGRRGKAGDTEARNKIIAAHRPLVFRKTEGMIELRDIRQECMERLITTAWNDWEPERSRFSTFAEQAIDWAIQDYLRKRRGQVPVQRSINVPTTCEMRKRSDAG